MLPTLIPSNRDIDSTTIILEPIIQQDATLPASFPDQGATQQATTRGSVETFDIEHGDSECDSESAGETQEPYAKGHFKSSTRSVRTSKTMMKIPFSQG